MTRRALTPTPEERISLNAAQRAAERGKFGWAALASLAFHGSALAAVLIAAAGQGPQLPVPAIEVAVVMVPAPSGAASAGEKASDAPERPSASEQVEAVSDPMTKTAAVDNAPPPVQDPEPVKPEERSLPVAEVALIPEQALPPPPPTRKPRPPEAHPPAPQPAASDVSREVVRPVSEPPTQLAALPTGEAVDSAAAPGAGSEPPRYEAGGDANPWPRYPAAARRRGIEGEVLIKVRVGADGAAEGIEVLRSSGSKLLDEAAVEALERWHFEPARAAGQPVAGTVDIPVTFRLTDPGGS
jgi:periplasmic protein TonB